MARYEHLLIYQKSMDLTSYFEQIVRNFSRYIRSYVIHPTSSYHPREGGDRSLLPRCPFGVLQS